MTDAARRDVFLTGGTGLLGSHIAERLEGAGRPVVALQRESSHTDFLESLGSRVVRGDLRDSGTDLASAISEADAVVHGAAAVYRRLSWPRTRALNVDGTRRVARAALEAGVRHFIHLSSVAVYGAPAGPVDESDPADGSVGPEDLYARSKREAEELVLEMAREEGLPVTVLRPAVAYGERDRLFTPRLGSILRLPLVPLVGSGRTPLPVVYAGNVADAVARILAGDGGGGAVYNLATDHPLDLRGLFTGLARGLGRRGPRFLPLPVSLLDGAARAAEAVGRRLPGAGPVPPFRRVVALASRENPYRSRRVREDLGWTPPVEPAEALERTGRWLASRGPG